MKRVVILSDLHCGHIVGLTPDEFNPETEDPVGAEAYQIRQACWRWFAREITTLRPIDLLLANGDLVDGKNEGFGGTELITADRNRQATIAAAVLAHPEARHIFLTYGTPYHAGLTEDWEAIVAEKCGAEKIGSHEWFEVEGLVFDLKHFIPGSQVPHTRNTALARERLWNVLWSEHSAYPKADVIVRSHVHYHTFCGERGWLAMTTPALQGFGGKFGARRLMGTVHFGFVVFDVVGKEHYTWTAKLLDGELWHQEAVRI